MQLPKLYFRPGQVQMTIWVTIPFSRYVDWCFVGLIWAVNTAVNFFWFLWLILRISVFKLYHPKNSYFSLMPTLICPPELQSPIPGESWSLRFIWDVGNQFIQDSYNVNYEVERKKALNIILSQSRQQDREDAEVILVPLCDNWKQATLRFCCYLMKHLSLVVLKPTFKGKLKVW